MIDGPCPPGHKTSPDQSISITRLAVETSLFPLFEVDNQKYKINYFPEKRVPVEKCMKLQGRFSHLFKNNSANVIQEIQDYTDHNWQRLNELHKQSSSN